MFLITTNCLQSVYNIHSVDFTKPTRPTFFSWARTATLCLGVEHTVRSTPRPAKLSAHLGDYQATGCCRNQNPNLFYLRTTNVHFTVDAIMYMYVNNLTDPWFSIYNVRKCEVKRKICNLYKTTRGYVHIYKMTRGLCPPLQNDEGVMSTFTKWQGGYPQLYKNRRGYPQLYKNRRGFVLHSPFKSWFHTSIKCVK